MTNEMANEEAIAILEEEAEFLYGEDKPHNRTAFDMAIKALSTEPCREADDYENEIADLHNRLDIALYDKERYKEEITALEAEIKGKWIYSEALSIVFPMYRCSNCAKPNGNDNDNFCSRCGADMRGGKE